MLTSICVFIAKYLEEAGRHQIKSIIAYINALHLKGKNINLSVFDCS